MAKTTKQLWIVRHKTIPVRGKPFGYYSLFAGKPPKERDLVFPGEVHWWDPPGCQPLVTLCDTMLEKFCPGVKLEPGEGPYPVEFRGKITKPRPKKGKV